jgi:hypothetical protein
MDSVRTSARLNFFVTRRFPEMSFWNRGNHGIQAAAGCYAGRHIKCRRNCHGPLVDFKYKLPLKSTGALLTRNK